jgi:hypothetical protein
VEKKSIKEDGPSLYSIFLRDCRLSYFISNEEKISKKDLV